MARERKIMTRPDGSLYYPLTRTRQIEVPGTKGLQVKEHVDVPQLSSEGEVDVVLQNALNIIEGKDDNAKVEKLVEIINAGLVADAQTAIQTALNRKINSSQIVSDFGSIVTLTKSMFGDMSDSDRAMLILEKFPEIAQKLQASGLELLTDDVDVDEDEEE